MKNVHVLPTPQPSRLVKGETTGRLLLHDTYGTSTDRNETQNIYITSDEEIKEDEYYLGEDNNIYCLVTTVNFNGKKIILTTDQDLIKDGVQAIDDDFLEWFVNNPSCEEVEIEKEQYHQFVGMKKLPLIPNYKIIIPKEEQKQETLEEVAEKYSKYHYANREPYLKELYASKLGFIDGAKWQQERMYSAEEVLKHLNHFNMMPSSQLDKYTDDDEMVTMKWFEQFKKK